MLIDFIKEYDKKIKIAILIGICIVGASIAAIDPDFWGYLQSWGGRMFRAISGYCLGWLFARYVLKIDLSALPFEHRGQAGMAMAVICAGGAAGMAIGA